MDKISLQGKCSIRNIQGQMVRISLQEEKQYLKYVITIWFLSLLYADARMRSGYYLDIASWYSGAYQTVTTAPVSITYHRAVSEITHWDWRGP